MNYYNIVPLTKIPLNKKQVYYYKSKEKIKKGQLVKINFNNREINGIVLNNYKINGKEKLIKLIIKSFNKITLTNEQLKLSQWMSDYYFFPLSKILSLFIPSFNYKILKNADKLEKNKYSLKNKIEIKSDKYLNLKNKYFLSQNDFLKNFNVSLPIIKKNIEKGNQILILVPEIISLPFYLFHLNKYFNQEIIAQFHSKLTNQNYFLSWQKVKTGKAKIILGTRQAVFAPFKNLKTIFIQDEQNLNYKQWDMNPRYEAKTVASELLKLFSAKLILLSSAPSIESYYYLNKGKYKSLFRKNTIFKNIKPVVRKIDLSKEYYFKNFSPLSMELQEKIEQVLDKNRQVFLWAPYKGYSRFTVCQDCGYVFKCPHCNRYLITTQNNWLSCPSCSFKQPMPLVCPKCKSAHLKSYGWGVQKIEQEVIKLYPKAKVLRIDEENIRNKKEFNKIVKVLLNQDFDIVISTKMFLGLINKLFMPNIQLSAVINFNSLLTIPYWRAQSQIFSQIIQLISNSQEIIIQAFDVQDKILNILNHHLRLDLIYDKFYYQEIELRKKMKYPPFVRIIELSYKGENLKQTTFKAEKLINNLKKLINLKKYNKFIKIVGPITPFISKVKNKYILKILLKFKTDNKKIKKDILKKVPMDWTIDINPV